MSNTQPSPQPTKADAPVWGTSEKLIVYADPWETPPDGFFDIYDLLPPLCQPTNHTRIDGRRGVGKTVLMVNAYLNLRHAFERTKGSPPYTVAIFVDLSQDVFSDLGHPVARALQLYHQILGLILTASRRPGHRRDRRLWGLGDFLDGRPNWFRRVWARWHLRQYKRYLDHLGEAVLREGHTFLTDLQGRGWGASAHAGGPSDSETQYLGKFQLFGGRARGLLEALLDAMQVERLILFVDEWSGSTVGRDTQPYLYDLLMQTFPSGGRVVLKLATIPGSTRLTHDGSAPRITSLSLDSIATARSKWVRERLTKLLIHNLKAYGGDAFPFRRYLTRLQEDAGFANFVTDVFQDQEAADEFVWIGDNLPRQLLLIFIEAARLRRRYTPDQKLSVPVIRQAAYNYFRDYLDTPLRRHADPRVGQAFDRILGAGSPVVDVQRNPDFHAALDWLVDEGAIFRCNPVLPGGFERYLLCFPGIVYQAFNAQEPTADDLQRFAELEVPRVLNPAAYPDPPKLNLADPPPDALPELADGQPAPAETRPEPAKGQPEAAEGQPNPAETRPEPAKGQPEAAEGQPDPAETHPELAEGQPDPAETRPELFEGQTEQPEGQPELVCTASRSEVPDQREGCSAELTKGRPEPTKHNAIRNTQYTGSPPVTPIPIFDGHNDTLTHLYRPDRGGGRSFFQESANGHLDLPRARAGGLTGGIFAIYTPPPESSPERDPHYGATVTPTSYDVPPRAPVEGAYARTFTDAVIDFMVDLEKESEGQVALVRSYRDLGRHLQAGVFSLVLGIEGAAAIREDLENLEAYYARGLRVLGPVWSRPNVFGHGVPFRYPHSPDTGPGLTEAGKRLVRACNRLGVLIDLAHLNARGFWNVAELSDAPLVVSHAGVHALCPSTRNLTDAQLDAINDTNGLVGIIFEPAQLRTDGRPEVDAPLSQILRHIDYVVDRIGVDHVAFGSDFDGATMPQELGDAAGLRKLIDALHEQGYDRGALAKIAYQNWFRVFKDTWKA